MPSLGGLLKKRRTKDSQTLSKEIGASSSPTTAQTQTSPNATDQQQQQHPSDGHSAATPTTTTTTPNPPTQHPTSDRPNPSSASHPASDGQPVSMQSAVSQSTPSNHPSPGLQQHASNQSNVASIQNIIHSPQPGSSHAGSAAQGGAQPSQQRTESRTTKGKYSLGDFALQRTLGTGSFGRVHLVQSKHNHRFYAIKVLKKAQVVKMKQVEHTNDERRMLNRVRHPFLITLWGTWQDSRNLYMVMDFVEGGELFSLLRKSQRFPNPVAKFYAAEVTLALEYLHSQQIIYRDLKPENLLLDRHGHLKITDFGFAKEVPDITWTLCGTPDYLAPEVVSSKGYNKSVDWWSLGILIFEMLCGFTPFWDSGSPVKIYENILRGRVKYPPYLNQDAVDLLSQLITADLTKRLGNLHGGSEDVKNHPWFAEVTWDRLARKDIDAPYVPPIRGGQGDASQYDRYPEETEAYGVHGDDVHGHLFPDF
ncbi:camp-dependent protein kinase catalytic subunit [Aspergillus nanangensis]|uniref:cAMP-dependent protein kinase n=1 Tax=Aspergillus nanangensis TaxID=2582783 RepID=A0AAD4CXY1_ASPNN|nr:camp-dependent protein kinase catalytic subunit [Aspergillus nanangensis]